MADGSEHRNSLGPFLWGLVGAVWFVLFQVKSYFTFHGLLNGFIIVLMIALLWGAGAALRKLQELPGERLFRLFVVTLLVALAGQLAEKWLEHISTPMSNYSNDITQNTVAAVKHFVGGENPYGSRSQLWYTIQPGPHTSVVDGQVSMYGVRYAYGYPYFPLMFLSYVPFYQALQDIHFMQVANGLLIILSSIAVFGLTRRLTPLRWRTSAGLFAVLVYLSPSILSYELILCALPDMVMMTYLVLGCWMLSGDRPLAAGAFIGMAQACKLLPAPLLAGALLLWLWKRPGFWRFLIGFVGASVLFIGPYLFQDPGLLLSSTILYYLTNHGHADGTSVAIHLPTWLQPIFSAAGILGALGAVLWVLRGRGNGILWPLSLACTGYLIFIASAKMIHLNYFWAIYPVACAVIIARLAHATDARRLASNPTPAEETNASQN